MITVHRYPRPWLRQLERAALVLALILAVVAIILEIAVAFVAGPLLCGMAVFTAILLIPLLLRTVLHPEVDIVADGLVLYPMLWPAQSVPWDALTGITLHPLIFNDEVMGRTLHGKNYRPREGAVILVSPDARLWFPYRIIGGVAGAGNTPAFAISSTTHTDYAELVAAIRQHAPESSFG